MKKKTYPRYNREKLDRLNRDKFDSLVSRFQDIIRISDDSITEEQVSTLAWNVAFTVLTEYGM